MEVFFGEARAVLDYVEKAQSCFGKAEAFHSHSYCLLSNALCLRCLFRKNGYKLGLEGRKPQDLQHNCCVFYPKLFRWKFFRHCMCEY